MPAMPWKLSRLTKSWPILIEMEDRVYKTTLIVVDDRNHWEGPRVGRIILICPDYPLVDGLQVGDRVLLRGSSGKTMDGYDKAVDEKFRFCRESDIEAVLPERLEVEATGRR